MMAGLHVSKLKLKDMRMVVFGSGTAGTGIADQVRDAIAADSNISKEDAAKQIWYYPAGSVQSRILTISPGVSTNQASY
jgi:malic enzyme